MLCRTDTSFLDVTRFCNGWIIWFALTVNLQWFRGLSSICCLNIKLGKREWRIVKKTVVASQHCSTGWFQQAYESLVQVYSRVWVLRWWDVSSIQYVERQSSHNIFGAKACRYVFLRLMSMWSTHCCRRNSLDSHALQPSERLAEIGRDQGAQPHSVEQRRWTGAKSEQKSDG